MANPNLACDPNGLAINAKCFSNQCLGPDDREAIEVYAMMQELKAIGGTDYTGTNGIQQLLIAAKGWQRLDEDTRRAIILYITVQNALGKGAVFASDINSLRAASKCILCIGWETRKNIKLLLKCLINQQQAPD